ncbi:MAG: hypothetical protein IH627_22555, partial [Rubrivivax sp.]|nr:hypothetical protein [Rubrivivax sp.]
MNNLLLLIILCFGAGLILGFFFFGGLRLTLSWLTRARQPLFLALVSMVARTVVTVAAFVWVGGQMWQRYAAAIAG